jgi:LysR family hydrogen peroxide-inducible transcriptional activator
MNINELRFIVAVAQELNFRKAAEKSFVSQPALSTAVQKLEGALGVKIFERSRTEVAVTPIGKEIVEQAERVLDELEKLRRIARQGQNQLEGPLHLGAIFTVGPYLLPELIPRLHQLAPLMPLWVEENTTAQLEEQLRNGKIDAAIVALPFEVPGIETQPLYEEVFEVVVPADHPWARKKRVRREELAGQPVLMLPSVHCFSTQILESCPEAESRQDSILQGNSLETIRNMVASGMGITVLPASANSSRYRSPLLAVIPFEAPSPSRVVGLAWRKTFVRPEAIEVTAQAIRQANLHGTSRMPALGVAR